jgi:plasmid stability protein
MASLTIKNIPDDLLGQLRQQATEERRSLNQQILRLLENALAAGRQDTVRQLRAEIEAQLKVWETLGDTWRTEDAEEEVAQIFAARSTGRKVDL